MNYQIAREGQQLGQFTEEQIRAGLFDGTYQPTDLAWAEGMADWKPLSEVFAQRVTAPPSLPMNMGALPPPMATNQTNGCLKAAIIGAIVMAVLFVGITILALLASLAMPVFTTVTEKGNITKAINNNRQIIMALKIYAADNNGKYPDAAIPGASNSNEVFHLLIKNGYLNDERMFGSPASPFKPDGNIGTAPNFDEALKPGENHWAMTRGMDDAANGGIPLVYENPWEATWPPKWNATRVGRVQPGRVWSGPSIIIGFNDGSVSKMKLDAAGGESAGLRPKSDGTPVFPLGNAKLEVLNVAK